MATTNNLNNVLFFLQLYIFYNELSNNLQNNLKNKENSNQLFETYNIIENLSFNNIYHIILLTEESFNNLAITELIYIYYLYNIVL